MSKTRHTLKTTNPFFSDIYYGFKKAELRYNDRNFTTGDILILKEYDGVKNTYTGREVWAEICHILSNFKGLESGYVILSFSVFRSIDYKTKKLKHHVFRHDGAERYIGTLCGINRHEGIIFNTGKKITCKRCLNKLNKNK